MIDSDSGHTLAKQRGRLILVVDDDPSICNLAITALTLHGYQVITAGDGAEAAALFASRRYDIEMLITDIVIPKLDGDALARAVRHIDPAIKILAMSGVTGGSRAPDAGRFGGAFIFKPFKVQALLAEVERLFSIGPLPIPA